VAEDFRRGPAEPGQLPRGAATALSEGAEQAEATQEAQEATQEPPGATQETGQAQTQGVTRFVPSIVSQPQEPDYRPQSEEEQFLFGDTERPEEAMRPIMLEMPPEGYEQWLEPLAEIAATPGAPGRAAEILELVLARLSRSPLGI
jgi:hypothetical protein